MNKAAAIGFFAGICFLVLMVTVFGGGTSEKRQPETEKVAVPANDEGADSDSGNSAAGGKMLQAKPSVPVPLSLPKAVQGVAGVVVSRSVTGGYKTGEALEVVVNMSYAGTEKVTALALVERLPKGWTFQEVSGGAKPVIVPSKGAGGELTFVWVQVPAFPSLLSYRIMPGPDVAGRQEMEGQAVYRQLGPERRTKPVKTVMEPAGS